MKEFQKIIKYVAIGFGLYLAVTIISFIVSIIIGICTGIYGVQWIADNSKVERIDFTKEYERFSELDLSITAADLRIIAEGEDFKVETYQIPQTTKIERQNEKLIIKDTKKLRYNNDSVITIYVPEDSDFSKIKLEMGAGKVTIEDISADLVDFSFGAGSVKLKGITSKESKIECGAGEVVIEDARLNDVSLETGVGKLAFSGEMTGKSKIDCGIGEVDLNLTGGEEQYKIKTEKGLGEIKINGKSIPNETTTGDGENRISIEGGIGSININM